MPMQSPVDFEERLADDVRSDFAHEPELWAERVDLEQVIDELDIRDQEIALRHRVLHGPTAERLRALVEWSALWEAAEARAVVLEVERRKIPSLALFEDVLNARARRGFGL